MANFDDDDLDNLEDPQEVEGTEEAAEARPASNRNFLMALGIIGSLFVLMTIALVVVAVLVLPRERARRELVNAAIVTQNVATAVKATEEAVILMIPSPTPTLDVTPVPPTATATSVVAVPTNTSTAAATATELVLDARTATVAALLTQAVESKMTATPGNGITATVIAGVGATAAAATARATQLPTTGFADDVGLPGMFGMAIGLIVVIILVRRLRLSASN